MKNYISEQRARSFLVVGMMAFMAIWSIVFIKQGITENSWGKVIIAVPVACICAYALYSIIAGGKVSIKVESGVLTYIKTSWPKKNISFSLSDVVHIQIRNDSLRSRFAMKDRSVHRIGWVGVPHKFRDYIKSEYPSIEVEFIEGS
jgi:hypothetical protein